MIKTLHSQIQFTLSTFCPSSLFDIIHITPEATVAQLRFQPTTCLAGLTKLTEDLSQDIR
jgi:hypothetical protein